MNSLLTDVYVESTETVDDVILELLEGLPNTVGAPTGVFAAGGNPEVRFDGPTSELDELRARLGIDE